MFNIKTRRKVIIALCAFAIFIGLLILFLLLNRDAPIRYDKNIILSNKDEYTMVAEICYNDYLQNRDKEKINGYDVYTNVSDNFQKTINSFPEERKIYLNTEQAKAFDAVVATYKLDDHGESIFCIFIANGFVLFANERGQTMFIYSHNDKKPYGINASSKENDTYIEKICDHWYYACRKNVFLN